ncbi:MAG: lamin tail domain-containing protein, partial [Verrucomicrobiota bacterium]
SSPIEGAAETNVVRRFFQPSLIFQGTDTVNLDNIYLSHDPTNLLQWSFPIGNSLSFDDYLVVWADSEVGENSGTNYHASFTLNPTGGTVVLSWLNGTNAVVLDSLSYGLIGPNQTYGIDPDDEVADPRVLFYPTPDSRNDIRLLPATIRINEYMADNDVTALNSVGDAEDWFELYNAGSNAVDLSGYGVTDDVGNPFQWTVPTGVVLNAGGFLLIWADGNSTAETNDLHTNFRLSNGGEELAVFRPDGTLLDWRLFGDQEEDFSEGLFPDGSPDLYQMSIPTPGTTNVLFGIASIREEPGGHVRVEWNARENWLYDVYYRDAYDGATPWLPIVTNLVSPGAKHSILTPIDSTTSRRYFLIRQTKP